MLNACSYKSERVRRLVETTPNSEVNSNLMEHACEVESGQSFIQTAQRSSQLI